MQYSLLAVAVAVVGSAAAGTGCASVHPGIFDAAGYTSKYGYSISYESGAQQLLPADWKLDNFERERDGWVPKPWEHVTKYNVDDDDAAGPSATTIEGNTYALHYEHRSHGGVIWLRDIPIAAKLRSRDLRVLMQSYIAEIAGATYETVPRDDTSPWESKPPIVIEHRRAATVLAEGPAVVAGRPAYAATIEIANVDEVRVAPQARISRIQLLLLRAPRDEVYESIRSTGPTHNYPVLLLAGYSNLPAEFAKGLDDFHALLRKIAIAGKTGLDLPDEQRTPQAPPPPPRLPVI